MGEIGKTRTSLTNFPWGRMTIGGEVVGQQQGEYGRRTTTGVVVLRQSPKRGQFLTRENDFFCYIQWPERPAFGEAAGR